MLRSLVNPRAAATLALAVILCSLAARGEVVILKDGYTIHGMKLRKEKDVILDEKTGLAFPIDKPNGMIALDDGPRWVVFPSSPLQLTEVNDNNRFRDFPSYTRDRYAGDKKLPPTARDPEITKHWDPKEWTRVIRFQDIDPRIYHEVKQHINVITPHYVRVGSSSHRLTRYFLLKEFKPDQIRQFLIHHPDLAEPKGKPDPERRERLIRFWILADWLDEADKELTELLVVLPDEKARYARLKSEVNALRISQLMTEIERARDAGRHQWAIQALATFPKDDVPKSVATKVTTLRAEYETRTTRFAATRRHLDELTRRVPANANQFLVEAAKAVRAEVHLDTLARLDMFITLADRAEKDAKDGRRPSYSPEELLSAAITGWHLGKVAAEAKVGTAYKVWMTRQMALEYLRTTNKGARQTLLEKYLGSEHALPYDELEKLVSLLPPPEAPAELPRGIARFDLVPSVAFPKGVTFFVQLPEEYQPGRSYPLLILLADAAEDRTPDYLMARFGDLAARHGYIVAAPQWWDPTKSGKYTYTREEQATVLQMLRHLRRAFQVDADRVFLWGNSEGGALALDLGASHPDMFAGVVPVNPSVYQPLYIPVEYWVNFHQLPVYMIMGDTFGPSVAAIRMMSERWMPRGFPSLVVSYKGRGEEWFAAELPYAFDWMSRKRRADPGKTVGPPPFGDRTVAGFSSVRHSNNRFHWLSSEDIRPERTMDPVLNGRRATPAKFSARILEGNTIEVRVSGLRQLTVWFGKGMVDYGKPVTVKLDRTTTKPVKKAITPEIPVLMEDLYERGDRQRPFFARMDFKLPG